MVFSKLSAPEKDAFFGLLDEYFRSRPELFGPGGGQGGDASASTNALGLAAARAIIGGAASAAASSNNNNNSGSNNAVSSLNKFSANNPYRSAVLGGFGGRKNDDADGDNNNNNNSHESANAAALGRVAAATLAFSGGQNQSSSSSSAAAPPPPGHRVPGAIGSSIPVPPASGGMGRLLGTPGGEVDKLVSAKTSVLGSFRRKGPQAGDMGVALPPAFAAPKNTFGPPPVRRTTSASTAASTTTGSTTTNTGTRSVPPAPSQPAEEVEVGAEEGEYAEGEWAEVLYDYNSEDPGDLPIEAGSRVFVTAKSSEDWWTGRVEGQGKEGLFPASYVKLL